MLLQRLTAFLAGALMPLAFAPFSIWPLVLLSPALLIYQLNFIRLPQQAFVLGWIYGLGYFGFGVSWIYNSLHVFGHAPPLLAAALTGLMIVTLACFIGAAVYAYKALQQRYQHPLVLWSLPLIWFCAEWLKGWVLTGFPWLSVGYAHINSPLSGFAPLIGVYGLSALSILISLWLVHWKNTRKVFNPLAIVGLGLAGYALQWIDWTEPFAEPVSISMVQGNIAQEMKWRQSERDRIIQTYWEATRQNFASDLIVWPEAAIPGRSSDLQQSLLSPLAQQLKLNNSHLLTGILYSEPGKSAYYNSMLLLGEQQAVYHKRHLVAFGEYYPFRSILSFMQSYIRIPMSDMTAGPASQPLMMINGVKLGVSICFEDVFSRDINLDLPAANVLVNTSNDAWFGDSLAPHQHLQIAQMRALETGRPMVRSTNTGQSAFIDHTGQVIDATDQFKAQTLTTKLQGRTGSTPFLLFAHLQPWLSLLVFLLILYLLVFQRPAEAEPV